MPEPAQPINVLLVGPSQNGKSTFINLLRGLARNPQCEHATEGEGTKKCTTEPKTYELELPRTAYKLVNVADGLAIELPDNIMELLSWWRRKDLKIQPKDYDGQYMKLRLIDTPGLDDNEGRDADGANLLAVLRYLSKLSESADPTKRYISCLILITNANNPFSDAFQQIVRHYKRCMPNLFGTLAVINTNFSVQELKKRSNRLANLVNGLIPPVDESPEITIMRERRQAFTNIFHIDPLHFFIDSKPNAKRPLEKLLTQNTISNILEHLSLQGAMQITHMRLIKFPSMLAIDTFLTDSLQTAKRVWEIEHGRILKHASSKTKTRAHLVEITSGLEAEIEDIDLDLDRYDSDVEYNLKNYTSQDEISLPAMLLKLITFSTWKNTMNIKEDVWPFEVCTEDKADARWIEWSMDTESKSWTGRYEANFGAVPLLRARSFTRNKYFFASEIERLRKKKENIEIRLAKNEVARGELEEITNEESSGDNRITLLGGWISKAEKLMKALQVKEISLNQGFTREAQERYGKRLDEVSSEDLLQVARAEDIGFATALELAIKSSALS